MRAPERRTDGTFRPLDRRSFITHSTATALGMHSVSIAIINLIAGPVEQPCRVDANGAYIDSDPRKILIPSADMPIDELMAALPTLDALIVFLQENTAHHEPEGPLEFLKAYRRSPQALQQDEWSGPCNNFAEFSCHWGAVHGLHMYLLSVRPRDTSKVLTESWHQVAVFRSEGLFYIMEHNVIKRYRTLAEYEEESRTCILQPLGGLVPWVKTKDNPAARFLWQTQPTLDEREMEESPPPPRSGVRKEKPIA